MKTIAIILFSWFLVCAALEALIGNVGLTVYAIILALFHLFIVDSTEPVP